MDQEDTGLDEGHVDAPEEKESESAVADPEKRLAILNATFAPGELSKDQIDILKEMPDDVFAKMQEVGLLKSFNKIPEEILEGFKKEKAQEAEQKQRWDLIIQNAQKNNSFHMPAEQWQKISDKLGDINTDSIQKRLKNSKILRKNAKKLTEKEIKDISEGNMQVEIDKMPKGVQRAYMNLPDYIRNDPNMQTVMNVVNNLGFGMLKKVLRNPALFSGNWQSRTPQQWADLIAGRDPHAPKPKVTQQVVDRDRS